MKFGEKYSATLRNAITGETMPVTATYKRIFWNGYHTNDGGDGLWFKDRQLLGTCQFTVRGCKTEKTAKAKIRKYIMKGEMNYED